METERVTLRTENAILTEKLAQAKMEVDSAKKRETTQLNERVFGIEAECRALKEEVRRKDLQIGDLTNEAARASNEHAKRVALVEQEREFLRRDLQASREHITKREAEIGDTLKMVRERDEKIKSQRSKKKALKKEIEEMRAQVVQAS